MFNNRSPCFTIHFDINNRSLNRYTGDDKLDNSKRVKHNALDDCHLLKEIYINLLDQKEPKLDLKNNEIIGAKLNYNDKKNNNTPRKIIKLNNDELQLHKKYLQSHLSKNNYN